MKGQNDPDDHNFEEVSDSVQENQNLCISSQNNARPTLAVPLNHGLQTITADYGEQELHTDTLTALDNGHYTSVMMIHVYGHGDQS